MAPADNPEPAHNPEPGSVNHGSMDCGILLDAATWFEAPGFDRDEWEAYMQGIRELQDLEGNMLKYQLCASLTSYRERVTPLESVLKTVLAGVSLIKDDIQQLNDGESLDLIEYDMVKRIVFMIYILPELGNLPKLYSKANERSQTIRITPEDMDVAQQQQPPQQEQ